MKRLKSGTILLVAASLVLTCNFNCNLVPQDQAEDGAAASSSRSESEESTDTDVTTDDPSEFPESGSENGIDGDGLHDESEESLRAAIEVSPSVVNERDIVQLDAQGSIGTRLTWTQVAGPAVILGRPDDASLQSDQLSSPPEQPSGSPVQELSVVRFLAPEVPCPIDNSLSIEFNLAVEGGDPLNPTVVSQSVEILVHNVGFDQALRSRPGGRVCPVLVIRPRGQVSPVSPGIIPRVALRGRLGRRFLTQNGQTEGTARRVFVCR